MTNQEIGLFQARQMWLELQTMISQGNSAPVEGYDKAAQPLIDLLCDIVCHSPERDDARKLLIEVARLWPFTDELAIERARREFAEGLGIDLQDIIAELEP